MAKAKSINNKFGRMVGWNRVTTNMMGRDIEAYNEITYSDETEIEGIKGAGGEDIGVGDGNTGAKCSLDLLLEEIVALQRSLPPGSNLTDIEPFDITVQYQFQGFRMTDIVRNCLFKSNGRSAKQGDKKLSNKYDLYCSNIDWNVV